MTRYRRVFLGLVIILLVVASLAYVLMPTERVLVEKDFSAIGTYPAYYYANFTVDKSDSNAALKIRFNVNSSESLDFIFIWALYNATVEQFEQSFNITLAEELANQGDWDKEDWIWYGWMYSSVSFLYAYY